MPDPTTLKVNDKVKFISIPKEWSKPGYRIDIDSINFIKLLIKRKSPSRVFEIDEYGYPFIAARTKEGKLTIMHTWLISEHSGWRKVKKRT